MPTVPLAMWGFIPFVFLLFAKFPPPRATVIAFMLAWMFLPEYTYKFPGLPDFDKAMVAATGVLLASLLFARQEFSHFRFGLQDVLVLFFCATPALASMANDLGLYDAMAFFRQYITTWFVPYLVGRVYLRNWEAMRDLAWGIFLGGLIYVPLCLIEMRLSPQLHNWVYGFHAHEFLQSIRAGGFRPTVFMTHGLMVGMWMMMASLMGLVLWRTGQLEEIHQYLRGWLNIHLDPRWAAVGLVLVFVACRSFGALILFVAGWACFELALRLKSRAIVLALVLATPVIVFSKLEVGADYTPLVKAVEKISHERAMSLKFRLDNEHMLVEKAAQKPLFGWGGWGRSHIYDQSGNDISITDAYWIILFGEVGVVGLTAFLLVVLIPALLFLHVFNRESWDDPRQVLMLAMSLLLPLYALDCLLNDMKNPVYMLIAGGLITYAKAWRTQTAPQPSTALAPRLI